MGRSCQHQVRERRRGPEWREEEEEREEKERRREEKEERRREVKGGLMCFKCSRKREQCIGEVG